MLKQILILTAAVLLVANCKGQGEDQIEAAAAQAAQPKAPSETLQGNDLSVLAGRSDVQQAFQAIEDMEARNIKRLIAITEIPAPPFEERERALDMAQRFRAAGILYIKIDAAGNVLARWPGSVGAKTIAVAAHIDTVFPAETDVTVRREGNVYYAPGIGDNSQGLVVLLSLIDAMKAAEITPENNILFVASTGEEGLGDLRGVRHMFRDGGPKIDALLAIDGGSAARLVTTAVGSNRYRVTFNGPGGHSYGHFGRAHPHQALARAITGFAESARTITENGPKATFSVGRIGGGTSINSIPFSSWMEVDMRSTDPGKLAELDAVFQAAMQTALKDENVLRSREEVMTIDIKPVGKRPAGTTPLSSSLVRNAAGAMAFTGLAPKAAASSTDANIPMSLGIPAVTMSRGGVSKNAHAPNESWENKDPHIAIQAALLTVLAEAGIAEE